MNSIYHRLTAFALLAMLILAPSVSFAKGNENKSKGNQNKVTLKVSMNNDGEDEDEDEDDKEEKRSENKANKNGKKACLRAFGHLISKGYIKNKGEVEFVAGCFLPFGIKKKFSGSASSTDTVAPSITNVRVSPNSTSARVTWDTNERADSAVFWSTAPNFSLTATSTQSQTTNELTREHSLLLENLSASTTYYLIVRSRDAASNAATSSMTSFTTHSLPADATAPVISSIAYLPATTTIVMSWRTDENATSKIYFSTSTPLHLNASSTQSVFSGALTQNHLLTATGLTASTTYYFAVESADPSGNKTTSPSFTLTTR